mmetsp:Transcript_2587/g.10498  ORF Transcript_2587/g.10498 Transcript_2587/m.10498 type:complete len:287 (-) Transcript_2587:504-1364(-)
MLSVAMGRTTWIAPSASPFLLHLADEPPRDGVDSSSEASAAKGASRFAALLLDEDRTSAAHLLDEDRTSAVHLLDEDRTSAVVPHVATAAGELTASPESAVVASNPSKYPPQYVPRSDTAVGVRKPLATPAGSAASPTVAAAFSISFAWMVSAVAVAVFCVAMDRASLARALAVAARARARRTPSSSPSSISATSSGWWSPNATGAQLASSSSGSHPTPRSTVVRSLGSEGRFWSAVHSSFSLGLVSFRSASKVRAESVRSGPLAKSASATSTSPKLTGEKTSEGT